MGSHGFPWVPMGPHGSPWVPMGPMDFPWISHELSGRPEADKKCGGVNSLAKKTWGNWVDMKSFFLTPYGDRGSFGKTEMSGNILRIDRPRASNILSHRIVGFIKIHDFRHSWIHGDPKNWTHGDPWGPHETPWDRPMGPHGDPWEPMGIHGTHGFSMDRFSMDLP